MTYAEYHTNKQTNKQTNKYDDTDKCGAYVLKLTPILNCKLHICHAMHGSTFNWKSSWCMEISVCSFNVFKTDVVGRLKRPYFTEGCKQ